MPSIRLWSTELIRSLLTSSSRRLAAIEELVTSFVQGSEAVSERSLIELEATVRTKMAAIKAEGTFVYTSKSYKTHIERVDNAHIWAWSLGW